MKLNNLFDHLGLTLDENELFQNINYLYNFSIRKIKTIFPTFNVIKACHADVVDVLAFGAGAGWLRGLFCKPERQR